MDKEAIHFLNEQSKEKKLSDTSTSYIELTKNAVKPIIDFYIFLETINKEKADDMLKAVISGITLILTENLDEAYNLLNEAKQELIKFEKKVNEAKK